MKCFRLFFAVVLATTTILLFSSTTHAQSPSQQFGIGAGVSGSSAASISTVSSSIHFAYAISPAFHIGSGFAFSSLTVNKTSINSFGISPYAKFLFMGPNSTIKPYLQGALSYRTLESSGTMDFGFGGGGEYFVNKNLGIYAGVTIFQLNISDDEGGIMPFDSGFGILGATIGAEWFF